MSYFEQQLNSDEATLELRQLIASIAGWLETSGFQTQQFSQRFENIDQLLEDKRRKVLFLAEFSRGKTELINTTIFGSMGQRFLPSSPGRTTRCTTVIQYNPEKLPSIRLLPTMGSDQAIRQPVSMLAEEGEHWKTTLFSTSDPDSVVEALNQLAEVEMVEPKIASELGFLKSTDAKHLAELDLVEGKVAIPKFRHAVINFPHPLLRQGLTIVDTPGLNALGIEPELTYRALESANAIVFVLSADTGITRSELATWNEYVKRAPTDNVIVAINKIDTLWDEIKAPTEVEKEIRKQVSDVSRILGIPQRKIFPVSAQKSLVARKKNDVTLTDQSGIVKYEQALADTINFTNRKFIIEKARGDLVTILGAVKRVLRQRAESTQLQIADIEKIKDNQVQISDSNIAKIRKERSKLKSVAAEIDAFRRAMVQHYEKFVEDLNLFTLDKLIARYRFEISNKLTSTGLQKEMNQFQLEAVEKFTGALSNITRLEGDLIRLFSRVESIIETEGLHPRKIHPHIYLESLKKYNDEHVRYSKGLTMVITEQNALRDRYHASVMVKIRKLYKQARDEIDLWCRSVLVPLELELKERESQLKRRLLNLERVRNEDSMMMDEIRVLSSRLQGHQQRMKTIDHFMNRLDELSQEEKPLLGNVIDLQTRTVAS